MGSCNCATKRQIEQEKQMISLSDWSNGLQRQESHAASNFTDDLKLAADNYSINNSVLSNLHEIKGTLRLDNYHSLVLPQAQTNAPPPSMIHNDMNRRVEKVKEHYDKLSDKFKGKNKDPNLETFGPVYYDDGSTYTGQYLKGQKHGYGEVVYLDGSSYVGNWKNDLRSGAGVFLFSDGEIFIGKFLNDKANGMGRFRYENGDVYRGEYKNNMRHGAGEFV